MTDANAHENTPFGAYGEFEPGEHDNWTPEQWEEYYAEQAEQIALDEQARWEADEEYQAEYWSPVEQGMYDDDPSPYNGDYSEM